MKKIISVMVVFVLSLSVFSGCGKSDNKEESAKGIKMFMTASSADTFRQELMDIAKQKAEEMGAELIYEDAENSLEKQLAQIERAVKEKYDVILCNPVDVDTALQLQVTASDIPIVFWNSCPDDERLESDKYVFVGSNESDAGKYQAEFILDKFKNQDSINVAIFEGEKLHSATLGRTNALKDTLNKSGKTINYVFDDYADWNEEIAKQDFEIILKTGQKADVVACNNDSMALGVLASCEEHGIGADEITVVGVDATADGCKSIEEGKMAFTVYQSAAGQGEYAVLAAARLAKGKSLDGIKYLSDDHKYIWVPFEKVDKSNVADYK